MENKIYKIYNYMNCVSPENFTTPPFDYNYNILGLSKKRIFTKGELDRVDYYGYVDSGGTYQDLVLSEYREYYRRDRMVYLRRQTIYWYHDDNTTGSTKTTDKFYSLEESIKLGVRRRGNIISNLKIEIIGLIQMTSGLTNTEATIIGMEFLDEFSNEIYKFVEGVEEPLKDKLTTCEHHSWLNADLPGQFGFTIRQYLLSQLEIDYSDKIPE
jgi:hypothetical protein